MKKNLNKIDKIVISNKCLILNVLKFENIHFSWKQKILFKNNQFLLFCIVHNYFIVRNYFQINKFISSCQKSKMILSQIDWFLKYF